MELKQITVLLIIIKLLIFSDMCNFFTFIFLIFYLLINSANGCKFDEGYILPFLNIIGKTLESKYSKQFCYIIYITNTQDIDFRFHIYRKEEGLWLDENIEQDPNPLLYELL